MDDLVTQRDVAPTRSVRVSLIDYLVLQTVSEWNALGRADRLGSAGGRSRGRPLTREQSNFAREDAGARVRAVIALIAGELAHEGFPFALALRFGDPDREELDIISSAAIDDAIGSMVDAGCLAEPDESATHYTVTDDGYFNLHRANIRIGEYEELFFRMPDIFFAAVDFVQYYPRTAPRVRLRTRISDMVRDFYAQPSSDLRDAMVKFAVRLLREEGAPRGYFFHPKFAEHVALRSNPTELRSSAARYENVATAWGVASEAAHGTPGLLRF